MPTLQDRIEGGLVGLLVGDALGVPYEFHRRDRIPAMSDIAFTPPPNFDRSHQRVPAGTWSDDGAQALILLASLLDCEKLDLDDLGRRFINWYEQGYKAVDNVVFDVGIQTAHAIRSLMSGTAAREAGPKDERANGNGSLMRSLPLALWHRGTDEQLVRDAHEQSVVTHGHLRSQICCALYCLWARYTLHGETESWRTAVSTLRNIYGTESDEYAELEWSIRPDDPPEGSGSGYVVDCLRSAHWAVGTGSYEQVVKSAISLGQDTDTTACVAGGIAGIRDGVEAIPKEWRNELRGKELYEEDLRRLLLLQAR